MSAVTTITCPPKVVRKAGPLKPLKMPKPRKAK